METAQIMLSTDLLRQFRSLPQKIQKAVAEFIASFQQNPHDPSLYVHDLNEDMRDKKVRGAKLPDGYRAILIKPEKGNTWLMMYVDSHDRAYAWARNKRFEMHERTGVFQVFDVEEIEERIQDSQFQTKPAEPGYPLASLDDETLFQAGVPRPLIPSIKAITSDEQFEALAEYLPPLCREVLTGLAAGMPLDEALETTLGERPGVETPLPEGTGDFTAISTAPSIGLTLLTEGDTALKRALEGSLEEWRVFLHPSQRKIVEWHTKGAAKVTGSAGTGKTVALMHRAVYLARRLTEATDRVLLTTFTVNLAHNIHRQLQGLDPEAAKLVEVVPLFALARSLCHAEGWRGSERFPDELGDIWERVWKGTGPAPLPLSREEIQREFAEVIDPFGIDSLDEYLTVVRTGRPRLLREQRKQVWDLLTRFSEAMKEREFVTPNGLLRQARLIVEERGSARQYRHVLVDEVQDFSLEALRLIRALAPKEPATDPLFLAGDGHQRIYGHQVPLSRAGIRVVGRSKRLKVNYRTTQEIRKWAHAILTGVEIDDLDGASADTRGDRSLLSGPPPVIVPCRGKAEEADCVVSWVKDRLSAGLKPYEICVTPATDEIVTRLQREGIPSRELKANEADLGAADPGVRYGSRERIKGLEFKAVALLGFQSGRGEADGRERAMDYVAATRAREALLVTSA